MYYYYGVLFRKQTIEHTITQWEKDFNLSCELKFILKICLNWLYQEGYHNHHLINDFITQHLQPSDDKDHIRPWIKNNMEAIINVFYEQKRFDLCTYSLLNEWVKTKSIIDEKGLIYSWHPYKRNYQVAIYLEKEPFNEINFQQLNHFLSQIGYKPLCYNIIHTPFSSFINCNQLPHHTCPYGKNEIHYYDPVKPIQLIKEIAHIPCVIFGGNNLNLSSDCNFMPYPSYKAIEHAIKELSTSHLMNTRKIDLEPDDNCLIQ